MRRKANRPNATGRNNNTRFARLDHKILNSAAYRSLTPNARSLLVELTMLEKGDNNGSLYLSVRDAAHRMGVADLTAASRAFDELIGLGFIEMTQEAHFAVKASDASRARTWRLTWLNGPRRKVASWKFLECEPEPQTTARKRMERGQRVLKTYRKARDLGRLPVLDSNTISTFSPFGVPKPVLDSNTLKARGHAKLPNRVVLDSATHIAATRGSVAVSWWCTPEEASLVATGWALAKLVQANACS